ncbi:MAG TPA: hypothetical protein VK473_15750, partial [Terriglobales bacterium]|nr:hypothetical protein [Terriglobales bacterium]
DLPATQVQELYRRYGVEAPQAAPPARTPEAATQQPGGGVRARSATNTSASRTTDAAIVWKLLPAKSLQPIPIHIGLTDHTYTALTSGDLKPGDELVTGATTVKTGSSGPGLAGPRR